MVDIRLRPLTEEDHPLVYDAWIKQAWKRWRQQTTQCSRCGGRFTFIGKDAFCDGMHARITRLLRSSAGFAITTPGKEGSPYMVDATLPVVHMLYVAERWRKMGAATGAMRVAFPRFGEEEMAYTQDTLMAPILRRKWGARYNPFLVEG